MTRDQQQNMQCHCSWLFQGGFRNRMEDDKNSSICVVSAGASDFRGWRLKTEAGLFMLASCSKNKSVPF